MKMFTVTAQNHEAVNKCRDTVREIGLSERDNLTKRFAEMTLSSHKTTEEDNGDYHNVCDKLRYILFHSALGDAYKNLSMACDIIDKTDEELATICAESGETVQSAYKNATTNMMMDILTSIMQ